MKKLRIDPLIARAEEREKSAEKSYAESTRALKAQEDRLGELKRYADEYARVGAGPLTPALLQNRRAFVDRLEGAVGQQNKVLEQAKQTMQLERARLVVASRDTAVLEKLADSYRARERQKDNQRVQKEMDDFAVRSHLKRLAETSE